MLLQNKQKWYKIENPIEIHGGHYFSQYILLK